MNCKFFKRVVICLAVGVLCFHLLADIPVSYAQKKKKVELQDIYVKPGDTLHGISTMYLEDPDRWPEIYKYNKAKIDNPDMIKPGMKIKVPVEMIKEHLRAAHLITLISDVRARQARKTKWKKAKKDMKLFNEDSIRTMEGAVAQIKFESGEILKLGENSLIVLRPEEIREEALLKMGELRASRAKIITSSAIIDPRITGNKMPEFKAKIEEDKTTTLSVYKGKVDMTSAGKTITVSEGFMSEAKLGMPPMKPIELPPMPDLEMPSRMREDLDETLKTQQKKDIGGVFTGVYDDDESIAQTLEETSIPTDGVGIQYCHLQMATDFAFENIIVDKKLKNVSDYRRSTLKDGEYFWRVSYINQKNVEGPYSFPRSFVIDRSISEIEIIYPPDGLTVRKDFLKIRGRSKGNVKIKINGESAFISENGNFSKTIYLNSGSNPIEIEYENAAGKIGKKNRTVIKQTGSVKVIGKKSRVNPVIVGIISIALILFGVILLPT